MSDLGNWGLYALLCFIFPVSALLMAAVVRPKPGSDAEKEVPYECGVDTVGPTWTRFHVNYFKYALVFVLFDVETVFLYPWAVRFRALGWFAFVEMLAFILILAAGLWYAWKEGAFRWE